MEAGGPFWGVVLLIAGDGGGLLSVGVACRGGDGDVRIPWSVLMAVFFFLFFFFGGFPVISRRLAGERAPFGDLILGE